MSQAAFEVNKEPELVTQDEGCKRRVSICSSAGATTGTSSSFSGTAGGTSRSFSGTDGGTFDLAFFFVPFAPRWESLAPFLELGVSLFTFKVGGLSLEWAADLACEAAGAMTSAGVRCAAEQP